MSALLEDTKEIGVQRVFTGEIIGRLGSRKYVIVLGNGDVHEVHESRLYEPE